MPYRGDARFEIKADWGTIRQAQRFTEMAHAAGGSLAEQARARGIDVVRAPMSSGKLGYMMASRSMIWGVTLNERLNDRDDATVLAHEVGHSWIPLEGEVAYCRTRRGGRDTAEETASAIGALHAVPFRAVERLDLSDDARASSIAKRLGVATTFVYIRNSLAIVLGEKSGSRGDAFGTLELALLEHDRWVRDVSAKIAATAPIPPSTV